MNFIANYPDVTIIALLIPVLAVRWFVAPEDRKRTEWLLAASALTLPLTLGSYLVSSSLAGIRSSSYDLYIYQLDAFFGEPSFRAGRLVASHRWLFYAVHEAYQLPGIAMLAAFAINLLQDEAAALRVARIVMLNVLCAVPIYLLIPVSGPCFAFPAFPALPPTLVPHLIALQSAPNGIPSVHISTALLVFWFIRKRWWGRIAGITFVAFTVLATLGLGEHYLFDIFCSVPYTASVLWLESKLTFRNPVQTLDTTIGDMTWQRSQQ